MNILVQQLSMLVMSAFITTILMGIIIIYIKISNFILLLLRKYIIGDNNHDSKRCL